MKAIKELLSWLMTILSALAAALLINIFFIQPHKVVGISMEPTLHDGDIGIISKLPHTFKIEPDYNDIVIIDSRVWHRHTIRDDIVDSFTSNIVTGKLLNCQNHTYWIKRVIGKSGDIIEFRSGKLYRNGELLREEYLKEPAIYPFDMVIEVPEGHIFVMGDNRNHSTDSRDIGCIPMHNVIGKLLFAF